MDTNELILSALVVQRANNLRLGRKTEGNPKPEWEPCIEDAIAEIIQVHQILKKRIQDV